MSLSIISGSEHHDSTTSRSPKATSMKQSDKEMTDITPFVTLGLSYTQTWIVVCQCKPS
jgi:hypothetical protein